MSIHQWNMLLHRSRSWEYTAYFHTQFPNSLSISLNFKVFHQITPMISWIINLNMINCDIDRPDNFVIASSVILRYSPSATDSIPNKLYQLRQRSCRCFWWICSKESCSVSAINATPEHLIHQYGTIYGRYVSGQTGVYAIEKIIEKPSISQAELSLLMPGQRAGFYLCFFGMHVFSL